MQRRTSYYFRKFVTVALAAAAGLAVGMQIEPGPAAAGHAPQARFTTHVEASNAFVPYVAVPVLLLADPTHGVNGARECEAGIETDCIYL
jgi:hypothetical protein